jgi:dipeptidyl aminopeptidase/acylaminoacyl peptidase
MLPLQMDLTDRSLPERMSAEVITSILRIFVVLFAVMLVISLWGFYISIRPPKIVSSITPRTYNMQYENVSFQTADGITLRGWHVASAKETNKTLILLHGYPADKGNILPALAFLQKDFNLLLFDFRYLGESEGSYSTAGAKEVEDLLAAIRFLKSRAITEVGVWGFSMGGAVALMAIERAPEIRAVVAESSYASLSEMALEFFKVRLINYPIAYLIGLWAKLFLGIDLRDVSPAEKIRDSEIPILITHSSADAVIPFSQAKSLQQALVNNPRAEFWFSEEFAHGQLHADYQKRLETFFRTNL